MDAYIVNTERVSHITTRIANVSTSDSTKDTSFFSRLVAAVRVTQYNCRVSVPLFKVIICEERVRFT